MTTHKVLHILPSASSQQFHGLILCSIILSTTVPAGTIGTIMFVTGWIHPIVNFYKLYLIVIFFLKAVKDGWDPDCPSSLDAAVNWYEQNYFFKECLVYSFDQSFKKIACTHDIRKHWNTPFDIDAATRWGITFIWLKVAMSISAITMKAIYC